MFLPGKYRFMISCNARMTDIEMRLYLPPNFGAPFVMRGSYYVGHVKLGGAYEFFVVKFDTNNGDVKTLHFVNDSEDLFYSFPISHGNKPFYKIVEKTETIKAMESLKDGNRNVC